MDLRTFEKKTLAVGEVLAKLSGLATQFDIFRFMREICESYSYSSFLVCRMPARTTLELSGNTIITNLPSELLTLFDKSRLLQTSPVLRHMRVSTLPIQYSMDDIARERGNPGSKLLFERFNLRQCAFFAVHDAAAVRGIVAFFGDNTELSEQQLIELSYISIHVYDKLASLSAMDVRTVEALSERETDCLNWTSAGKTSAEIAEILELSEHTVNHYLNRATRKLDAVNRTQAVAKALRAGLIK